MHSFLAPEEDEGEWPGSRPGRITPHPSSPAEKRAPVHTGFQRLPKYSEKSSIDPAGIRTTDISTCSLVTTGYTVPGSKQSAAEEHILRLHKGNVPTCRRTHQTILKGVRYLDFWQSHSLIYSTNNIGNHIKKNLRLSEVLIRLFSHHLWHGLCVCVFRTQ